MLHNHVDVAWGDALLIGSLTFVLLLLTLLALLSWLLLDLGSLGGLSCSSLLLGESLGLSLLESLVWVIDLDLSEADEGVTSLGGL